MRSDVFTAYIVVRGYEEATTDNETFQPDNLVEQKRVIAVFDRTDAADPNRQDSRVRIIGSMEW